ncbi:MAG: zinc-dependent peptidase [Bacteroidia bacterium]|nr:zinc-dependent peptidase [Bacteroidia bacterium]
MDDNSIIAEVILYVSFWVWGFARYHILHHKRLFNLYHSNYNKPNQFNYFDTLLSSEMPYYTKLSINGKYKFIHRMLEVKAQTEFRSRENFELTNEVEYLISACITQLTFGFKSPIMPFLKGVVVFPGAFYSRMVENYVKGLAMGTGIVYISWEDFKEGYLYSTNTYNLGLHEFAHMLRFQSNEIDFKDPHLAAHFSYWEKNGEEVFQNIRHGYQNFFREYAGTNRSEFFSVCVENFFEVPEAFKQEMPDLYWHMCYLLKQNPLNDEHNYQFNYYDAILVNEKLDIKLPTYDIYHSKLDMEWWGYSFVILILLFIPSLVIFSQIVNHQQVTVFFRMLLVTSTISLFIRYHFYKSYSAIFNEIYLHHFVRRVLPLISTICFLYHMLFIL